MYTKLEIPSLEGSSSGAIVVSLYIIAIGKHIACEGWVRHQTAVINMNVGGRLKLMGLFKDKI